MTQSDLLGPQPKLHAKPKAKRGLDYSKAQSAPLTPPARRYRLFLGFFWLLLLAGAGLFVYPLWPQAIYEWHKIHPQTQPVIQEPPASHPQSADQATAYDQTPIADNRLIIPAIGVNTPIVEGSNLKVLDQHEGVWHQTGNLKNGNLVLAGHRFRYLPPNTSTLYDLDKLKLGDLIAVDWLGHRTVYKLTQMETVPANDIEILNPTPQQQLTVYSCSDIRQTHRVVAIAKPLPAP